MNATASDESFALMMDPSGTRSSIKGNLAKLRHMIADSEDETALIYADAARNLKTAGEGYGLAGDDLRSWVRSRLYRCDADISRRLRAEIEAEKGPLTGDAAAAMEATEAAGLRAVERALLAAFTA